MKPCRNEFVVGNRCRIGLLALVGAVACAGGASASAKEPARPSMPPAPPLTRDVVLAPGTDPRSRLRRPGDEVRLSNETTLTRWTHASRRAIVRAEPRGRAKPLARLRLVSASNAEEIYGVLRGRVDRLGRAWLQVRLPGRPNGRVGWAPATAFGGFNVSRTQLIVNRSTLRATLYRSGRKVWQAPVGVGKAGTPTPGGHFFVDRKEGAVFGPFYGTHVFFTNAFSSLPDWPGGGAIGIHGTSLPQLVPGRPSHGCVRVRNNDVARLARLMPVGTPLLIR